MIPGLRFLLIAGIAASALSSTACSVAAQRRTAETFVWQGQVAAGRTLAIKGVNGPVRAVAGSGSTARVEAIRSGRRSDPEEVEIVVLEHSDGVTVCAVYPSTVLRRNVCAPGDAGSLNANNNDVQVEFQVTVPTGVNFTARTTNGSVTAAGVEARVQAYTTNGDVEIAGGSQAVVRTTNGSVAVNTRGMAEARTTNGRITARIGALDGGTPLRFSTTNGSITLALPDGINANIDARTTNGRIESEFPVTVQGRLGRNSLSGTIGAGGQLIEAHTTNGGIRLERGS